MQPDANSSGKYSVAWRVGSRVFAPGRAATLAVLVLLPVFIGLGQWQLRRAEYKRTLTAEAAAGQQRTVVLTSANAATLARYQHVSVAGRFDSAHQVLLDNMPSEAGRPGYRVLTPLQLADGTLMLVDRGWVPLGTDRRQLPQVAVDATPRAVHGVVDALPAPGLRLGEQSLAASWPMVLNYPRQEDLNRLYGERLLPRVVLLDEGEPDGYERRWQFNAGVGPERHVGYAVQWFGFAVTLLLIYIFVNLRKVEKS